MEDEIKYLYKTSVCEQHGEYESKGMEILGSVLYSACPTCIKIKTDAEAKAESIKQEHREIKIRNTIGISKRNHFKTFDDFINDTKETSNQLEVCKTYAESVQNGFSGNLIMIGKVGTGKTLLASAIIESLSFKYSCRLIKFSEIMRNIRASYQKDAGFTDDDVIKAYSSSKLLVIDEMGVQGGTDAERQAIFEIIDNRYQQMLPTVIISNLDMEGLKAVMGERVVDRLREDGGKLLAFNSESKRISQ
jgi:DNA replication protein DnaC